MAGKQSPLFPCIHATCLPQVLSGVPLSSTPWWARAQRLPVVERKTTQCRQMTKPCDCLRMHPHTLPWQTTPLQRLAPVSSTLWLRERPVPAHSWCVDLGSAARTRVANEQNTGSRQHLHATPADGCQISLAAGEPLVRVHPTHTAPASTPVSGGSQGVIKWILCDCRSSKVPAWRVDSLTGPACLSSHHVWGSFGPVSFVSAPASMQGTMERRTTPSAPGVGVRRASPDFLKCVLYHPSFTG